MIIGSKNEQTGMGKLPATLATSTAAQIADQLSETDAPPRRQIRRILHAIGPERTQGFVTQALEVEANGGMLLPDGSRKRTLGGVFFRLVRNQVSAAEHSASWPCPLSSGRRQTRSLQRFPNTQERQPP